MKTANDCARIPAIIAKILLNPAFSKSQGNEK